VNWWDLDSLGQLWFAAENKIGGKYDDWECTKCGGGLWLLLLPGKVSYKFIVCFFSQQSRTKNNFCKIAFHLFSQAAPIVNVTA
jgi:hypothetical protein